MARASEQKQGNALYFTTSPIPAPSIRSAKQDAQDTTKFTLEYIAGPFATHEVQYCAGSTVCAISDPDNSIKWSAIITINAAPYSYASYITTITPVQEVPYFFRIRTRRNTQLSSWIIRRAQAE